MPRALWPDQEKEIEEKIRGAYVKMKKRALAGEKCLQAGKLVVETGTK